MGIPFVATSHSSTRCMCIGGWACAPKGLVPKLSKIECPSGSSPKAPHMGWTGDTLDYQK